MPVRHFGPLFKPMTRRNKKLCESNESQCQHLSLAVCDVPPALLEADRGHHAFFSFSLCSLSNCRLAYAAAASTSTWQQREKYVVADTVASLRDSVLR